MEKTRLKIMIIEDEASIRDSLTWFLEDLGHQVIAGALPVDCDVYKGRSCKKKIPCTDALLIDQHLPGMKGLDFITLLMEKGCKGMTANILLMSGDSTSIDMVQAGKLRIRVAQKPMSFSDVEEWLDSIVARGQ